MGAIFELLILYGQIAITTPKVEYPFNYWEQRHVNQGFVWRPESVCFGIDDSDSGLLSVEVEQNAEQRHETMLRSNTLRAILVPFSVPQAGILEIAAIGKSHQISIQLLTNTLLFQYGIDNGQNWCVLTFFTQRDIQPAILRMDATLSPVLPLYMDGQPAI